MTQRIFRHALAIALTAAAFSAPAAAQQDPDAFTIAVIPDTQNYIDFSHQREAGFPIDAKEIFFDQMAYIARNARSAGSSEEHTSELQSLLRISYAVFCLKKTTN